jgi:mannitol/fructose-specific phosphotransferase system IIA component (Ntr-type)
METPHLLMIACGNDQSVDNELRNMFRDLFSFLEQNNNMNIILTTQSGDIAGFIEEIGTETLGERFITTAE